MLRLRSGIEHRIRYSAHVLKRNGQHLSCIRAVTRRQAKKIEKIYQSFAGRLSLSHFVLGFARSAKELTNEIRFDMMYVRLYWY